MNRVEKLIAQLCPEGVEWKVLGDVAELVRGNGMPKTDLTDSGIGAIHYGQIYTRYGVWTENTLSFVSPEKAARLSKASSGDIIITNTSENMEDVCKAVAWLGREQIVTGGHATIIKHHENPKYLSYWFQSESFFLQKKKLAQGTKVIDVSAKNLAKVLIPLPPLAIQQEIVDILDKFTSLEAELEAELEARKTQYEFYRNSLLTFEKGVPHFSQKIESLISGDDYRVAKVGDIATFRYGFTAKATDSGVFRFIRITDITENGKLSQNGVKFVGNEDGASDCLVRPGDVLMARTGATYGKTVLIDEDTPAVYASFLIRLTFDESKIIPSYYWHFAQSRMYWQQANKLVSSGGQPQFNANVLKEVLIPVPSIAIQQEIVAILDKFDALVNDISIGLPAEIAARRKQYEYYRAKLLTFKRKEA